VIPSKKNTPYDLIADEYYSERHITSRNFDQVTLNAFSQLSIDLPSQGLVLEFGAGRGRAGQLLGIQSDRIIQSDSSIKMLSISDREPCLLKIQCDANNTPFLDNQFSVCCAFLCDPYYSLDFLKEVDRIVIPDGYFIATFPSFSWGMTLRNSIKIDNDTTKFISEANQEVIVPSFLIPKERLMSDLQLAGFKRELIQISSWQLPKTIAKISPHILISAAEQKMSPHSIELIDILVVKK
jgi:SAM-dependent methyltransferase